VIRRVILTAFTCFLTVTASFTFLFSASVQIGWTSPSTNEDGSPLEPGDLAGFEIYFGQESRFYSNGQEKPDFEYDGSIDVGLINAYLIEDLLPETTYYFAVKAYDGGWQFSRYCENPDEITLTTGPEDQTPPEILGVMVGLVTTSYAEIWWFTDEPSNSRARYGETTDYGYFTDTDLRMLTVHFVVITDLNADTTYHFQVGSRDAAGNLGVSEDMTFKTRRVLGE